MKATHILRSLIIVSLLAFGTKLSAQKGHKHAKHHHKHHPGKKVVVRRSAYRPAKVVVFHPVWRPKYAYYRRWVFFPKYNLYWDNWRNHYVFWNGTIWLSQPTAPAVVVNVNLENEKSKELKEDDDDTDDIYKDNEVHKKEN